jgi:hypothetical protein
MTRILSLSAALGLLVACSQDYIVSAGDKAPDAPLDDTGAATFTDPPVDETDPDPTEVEEEDPPDEEITPPEEDTGTEVTIDPPPEDDCDHASDLVYVIDRDSDRLYLFDPTDQSFDFVGDLDCGGWAGSPQSMAVSRDGFAYIRYSDDRVYALDLETMACTSTPYSSGAFGSFGMGFATDDGSDWRDTLYIANSDKLAALDTGSWALGMLGNMPSQSELTGNAAGELWAFLPLEQPAELVQIDKVTGASLRTFGLAGFPSPYNIDAFAFATWGGEFWLFVREYGMGNTTDLYRVDAAGNLTVAARDTGMDIVGAGVSTCAPTE